MSRERPIQIRRCQKRPYLPGDAIDAVYLSFDIDVLDPAFAPGTGTPEVGGLASWQAQAIMRRLGGLNFIGMDLVEVCPAYDVAEITALAGATMAWEYLCLLGQPTSNPND
jgi:arginase family enzyme